MRILLLALIALVSAPASATLIQIDITVSQNNVLPRGNLPPGDVTASLLLDTSAAVANFTTITQPGRPTCISNYRFTNLSMTILDVSVGGQSLFSGVDGVTSFGGDYAGACTSTDSQLFYDGGGSFSGDGPRVSLSMDTSYSMSIAELATAVDPVATFFLSRTRGNGTLSVSVGDVGGSGLFYDAQFSIREVTVPEPSSLGLLGAALLGLGAIRRRRPTRPAG